VPFHAVIIRSRAHSINSNQVSARNATIPVLFKAYAANPFSMSGSNCQFTVATPTHL
jgi:hypothetical protein